MTRKADQLVYRGSVKNIRQVKAPKGKIPGRYIFEFTDDYSVFDYGKMPDKIRGKGAALAMMSAYLFEELASPEAWQSLFRASQKWEKIGGSPLRNRLMKSAAGKKVRERGLATHYIGLLDREGKVKRLSQLREPTHKLLVKAVPVVDPRPLSIADNVIWDYSMFHPGLTQFLVPLENVFRFGVPVGSSLLKRLKRDPGYVRQIGLDRIPREGQWLERPVLEFFSKLEPSDRLLSSEAALNFSGLNGESLLELIDLCLLTAVFLYNLFLDRGLDLWDGKFEFVKSGDELLLADSITPDELRITMKNTQLSKEPLRQYYKKYDPEFHGGINAIKDQGPQASSIRKAVKARIGRPPKRLDPEFKGIIEQMYQALVYRITASDLMAGSMTLEDVVLQLKKL